MVRDTVVAQRYRILIADDHPVMRRGIRLVLESNPWLEVCGEAMDGEDALEMAKRLQPQLVVLDLTMPKLDGLQAAPKIREALPETEVLILTMHYDDELAREVLRSGARGYVMKTDADQELLAAVERIRHHGTFFTARLADTMRDIYVRDPSEEQVFPGTGLTPRETEIVRLVAEGKTNKEVATTLEVSIRTVESHRNHVMRKLKIASLPELVRFAIRSRLVDL
ncbi:MAG TPA: response regulator transcription factor [Verrucomicrobiae bacterium]|nr:response regulator transcription factor [Verrucomicrobiae bacterium]